MGVIRRSLGAPRRRKRRVVVPIRLDHNRTDRVDVRHNPSGLLIEALALFGIFTTALLRGLSNTVPFGITFHTGTHLRVCLERHEAVAFFHLPAVPFQIAAVSFFRRLV
jgi:hypothetical protein